MRTHLGLLIALGLSLVLVSGCSKGTANPMKGTMGTLSVRMTDAPADYQAVNLVITGVSAHLASADSNSAGGWEVLKPDSASYDLLALRNGVFTTIGRGEVPAGHYTQIRLMLGPGSNVVAGGITHPLRVPSGMQTGLKLVGSFDVPAGGMMDVALEFDAMRSIVATGSGSYLLKPTVRVMPFSTAGSIQGSLTPVGTPASIYALTVADTLGSAVAAPDGSFRTDVLPAGSYALAFHPVSGFRDTTIAGVVVQAGATTTVPPVALTPQ